MLIRILETLKMHTNDFIISMLFDLCQIAVFIKLLLSLGREFVCYIFCDDHLITIIVINWFNVYLGIGMTSGNNLID